MVAASIAVFPPPITATRSGTSAPSRFARSRKLIASSTPCGASSEQRQSSRPGPSPRKTASKSRGETSRDLRPRESPSPPWNVEAVTERRQTASTSPSKRSRSQPLGRDRARRDAAERSRRSKSSHLVAHRQQPGRAGQPAGPAPITATFLPVGCGARRT